jgi:hypothetical protein
MKIKLLRLLATIGELETRLIHMPTLVDDGSYQCPRCGSTHITLEERHTVRDGQK